VCRPPRGENDRPRRFEGRDGGGYREGGRDGGGYRERPAFGRGGGAPGGEKVSFLPTLNPSSFGKLREFTGPLALFFCVLS
jgi:hypothetical protein